MNCVRILVLVPLFCLLSACVTPYQSEGYGGGFTDSPLGGGKYRVDVRGNGYSSLKHVQDMALVRAADLTVRQGHNYFVILEAARDTHSKMAFGKDGGHSYDNQYSALTIKMVPDKEAAKEQALNARAILAELGPAVGYEKHRQAF